MRDRRQTQSGNAAFLAEKLKDIFIANIPLDKNLVVSSYKAMRDENLIMHAEISIGDSVVMFADATEQYPQRNAGMFIYVDDCDAVYKKAIENGAESLTEPADQGYGRSAGIMDPFGNTWWLTSVPGN